MTSTKARFQSLGAENVGTFPSTPALKSEISAHQRGQYGHRHTRGGISANVSIKKKGGGGGQPLETLLKFLEQVPRSWFVCLGCVYEVQWTCTITIGVILLVYGLAGALSVSILLSVELVLSRVLLCRSCKTGDTVTG